MSDWLTLLDRRLAAEPAVVRVLVALVRGSAPREVGACMLVGTTSQDGSIGGGHLELKATEIARQMLSAPDGGSRLDRFALGATLGQCCGGVVQLWFERFAATERSFVARAAQASQQGEPVVLATLLHGAARRAILSATGSVYSDLDGASLDAAIAAATGILQNDVATPRICVGDGGPDLLLERIDPQSTSLWLFGAGHVGKALVSVLGDLPLRITWIDSRDAIFPASVPDNVIVLQSDAPADEVRAAPSGSLFLVLTHSHDLDYEICRAILRRDDFLWAGLIGSQTKAARFRQRLARQDVSPERMARLTCPIGVPGVDSKFPAAIAIAVAAQLLQVVQAVRQISVAPGLTRRGHS